MDNLYTYYLKIKCTKTNTRRHLNLAISEKGIEIIIKTHQKQRLTEVFESTREKYQVKQIDLKTWKGISIFLSWFGTILFLKLENIIT